MQDHILTMSTRFTLTCARAKDWAADRLNAADRERGMSAVEYVILAAILFPLVVAAAIKIGNVITSRSEEIQP